MVKYHRNTVGSLLMAPERGTGGGGWQRLWPVLSAASLRRRLVGALVCGGGSSHKGFGCGCSRRFLLSRSPPATTTTMTEQRRSVLKARPGRLLELIRAEPPEEVQKGEEEQDEESDTEDEAEVAERESTEDEDTMDMGEVVARLRSESRGDRAEAARDVRRLAKGDAGARETMAELGAIAPLVSMVDDDLAADDDVQVDALYALLNLGIGNDRNKAMIVEAGALHCMLPLTETRSSKDAVASTPSGTTDATTSAAVVANLLSLSALDANKPIIGSSGAIPFLVSAYRAPPTNHRDPQARDDALRALFNLSLFSPNAPRLADAGLVPALLATLEDAGDDTVHSERALAVLSNILAASPEGRRELSRRAADAFPLLVDTLGWSDAPRCQEAAAYVLMVMAHRSSPRDRAAMAEAGAHSALLELTLLGTPLAQKRASKILEFLTGGKATRAARDGSNEEGLVVDGAAGCSMSGPQCGPLEQGGDEEVLSEERRAVKRLVQQSLESNMRRITRRANVPAHPLYFPPPERLQVQEAAGMAAAVSTNSSRSLPF